MRGDVAQVEPEAAATGRLSAKQGCGPSRSARSAETPSVRRTSARRLCAGSPDRCTGVHLASRHSCRPFEDRAGAASGENPQHAQGTCGMGCFASCSGPSCAGRGGRQHAHRERAAFGWSSSRGGCPQTGRRSSHRSRSLTEAAPYVVGRKDHQTGRIAHRARPIEGAKTKLKSPAGTYSPRAASSRSGRSVKACPPTLATLATQASPVPCRYSTEAGSGRTVHRTAPPCQCPRSPLSWRHSHVAGTFSKRSAEITPASTSRWMCSVL